MGEGLRYTRRVAHRSTATKNDATLGSQTLEAQKLDEAFDKQTKSIRGEVEQLRNTREACGEGSIYLVMQPMVRLKNLELVDNRIDVIYPFQIVAESGGKETVLRWCQGLVSEACENRIKPIVNVEWNEMTDVDGYEESSILNAVLLQSKWKKDVAMSQRMDVDAVVDEGEESESETETETETEIETETETESEEESEEETNEGEEIGNDLEVGQSE